MHQAAGPCLALLEDVCSGCLMLLLLWLLLRPHFAAAALATHWPL
jgi:hypothetical protein